MKLRLENQPGRATPGGSHGAIGRSAGNRMSSGIPFSFAMSEMSNPTKKKVKKTAFEVLSELLFTPGVSKGELFFSCSS